MNNFHEFKARVLKRKQRKRAMPNLILRRLKLKQKKGFGLNEVIGIAAGIIIALVVIIPGLKGFAETVVDQLSVWWSDLSTGVLNP